MRLTTMALVERYHSSQELKGSIPDESSKPETREASSSRGNKQGISLVHSEERAKHVGILALEVYFPNTYVCSSLPLSSTPQSNRSPFNTTTCPGWAAKTVNRHDLLSPSQEQCCVH